MSSTAAVMPQYDRDELWRRIRELDPWFHNIQIGEFWTAPEHFLGDYPRVKWKRFQHALPADLTGKTVLDIGCNAGFYSIEMKKRGAARVIGIDTDPHYLKQAAFVAEMYGVQFELEQMSIYDVGKLGEKFDLVLCLGVLYHLRHPLLALDLLHEHVVGDLLVLQTLQRGSNAVEPLEADYDIKVEDIFDKPGYPKMHFVEQKYSMDPTNWWIPNRACTEAMLRSAGFDIEDHPEEEVYVCRTRELTGWGSDDRAVYPARGGRND